MGIIGFIFSLFLFGLLFVLLRSGIGIYRAYRKAKNMFRRGPFNNGNHQEKQQRSDSSWFTWGKRQTGTRKKDKKIIPEDYGEYVEFTETTDSVKGEESSKQSDKNVGRTETYRESQIEDAEWEEIK